MTFDEKLKQALNNTAEARAEQMLSAPKEHKFSLAYRLWEYRTLKNLGRDRREKRRTLRRVKYIAAAVIVVAATLLLASNAAVTVIGRFNLYHKPEYSRMHIKHSDSDKTILEERYGLPREDGWRISNYYVDDTDTFANYERGGIWINLCQEVIHEGSMGNVNTEKADPEPVSLYEKNDGFILDFGKNGCIIFWIYDGYLFSLTGDITKDEAIRLACSVKVTT